MSFNIIDLIKYYIKKLASNLVVFIIAFILGLVYIFGIYETKYVASTTFMLGACFHECEEVSTLNVDLNKKVVFNYMELIKSNRILQKANENCNLQYSTKELKGMVSVAYEEDTEYIIITVSSKNKHDSAKLAYNLFLALGDEVERIFDIDNIHIVDTDSVGYKRTSCVKLVAYDAIIAFIITVIITIIRFLFFRDGGKKLKIKAKIASLTASLKKKVNVIKAKKEKTKAERLVKKEAKRAEREAKRAERKAKIAVLTAVLKNEEVGEEVLRKAVKTTKVENGKTKAGKKNTKKVASTKTKSSSNKVSTEKATSTKSKTKASNKTKTTKSKKQ